MEMVYYNNFILRENNSCFEHLFKIKANIRIHPPQRITGLFLPIKDVINESSVITDQRICLSRLILDEPFPSLQTVIPLGFNVTELLLMLTMSA